MRLQNLKVALFAILLSTGSVSAQDIQCKLKLVDLPRASELKGFQLGMTMEQVKARVPQVVFGRTDEFGSSKTSVNPFFDPRIDKSTFADVRTISLDFLDGRLTSLWLGYESTFQWPTVDDFVKGISLSLSLPNAWSSWKSRGQQLKCADFQMTVSIIAGGPSFRIVDLSAEETLTARRIAREEERSALGENTQIAQILADKKSKLYYTSGCQPEKEISETDRVVFRSPDEAARAGYKPAKNCQ